MPQQSEQEVSPPAEQSISKSNQYNRSGDERILADDSGKDFTDMPLAFLLVVTHIF